MTLMSILKKFREKFELKKDNGLKVQVENQVKQFQFFTLQINIVTCKS